MPTKEELEQQLVQMAAQMQQLQEQLAQQQATEQPAQQPAPAVSASAVIDRLGAQPVPKTKGLGYVWGESTHAVGSLFGAAGAAADSAKMLAKAGRISAVQVQMESAAELCAKLGVETTSPIDSMLAAEAIVDYLCDRRK